MAVERADSDPGLAGDGFERDGFLAWIAATGMVRANLRTAQIITVPLIAITLPLLVAARLSGQLAAQTRGTRGGSVLIVLHQRWARTRLLVVALLLVAVFIVLLAALLAVAPWAGNVMLVLIFDVGVVLLAGVPSLVHRWWTRRAIAAAVPAEAIELTLAVSWPRGHGYGRTLWQQLAASRPPGRPIVVRAASADLAATYARITTPPGTIHGDIVIWT